MSELSSGKITIDAPIAQVQACLFDLAGYPSWSTAIKKVEILSSDDQGRATSAKTTIDAGMLKDRVVLTYDWSKAPNSLEFSMEDADLLTAMNGSYEIKSVDEDSTLVTYNLGVDVSMPIPAMMRQKAEKATIEQALSQLKEHLEK
ncbi:MAG: polyketide cyclase / dehydrase and lipid transport [Actinobacteria bacterium]|nr:polyketide cyclase / dehydrase and lipid transport [Actinomycetota bacterium]